MPAVIYRTVSYIITVIGFVMTFVGGWYDFQQATSIPVGPAGINILLWGIIIYFIGSAAIIGQLTFRLHKIEHKKPVMKLATEFWNNVEAPIRNVVTGQIMGKPVFTHAVFVNDPKNSTEGAVAEKVIAHIEFYDVSMTKLLFPSMVGRWSETPERAQIGERVVDTNQIDLPPNAMPRNLDVVLKYDEEICCYGLNNETPSRAPTDWRDSNRKLTAGEYAVKIRLRGNNVEETFWLKLENGGADHRINLQTIPPNS
jgi:hypothetical protein